MRMKNAVLALGFLTIVSLSAPGTGVAGTSTPPVYLGQWGTFGAAAGQVHPAQGGAAGGEGNGDGGEQDNHRGQGFGPDGAFLRTWGTLGSGPGQFNHPAGIAVAPN